MNMPRRLVVLASLCASAALDAAAAPSWALIRESGAAKLSVDARSVKRKGGEVRFHYLVDFARPQGDPTIQMRYRSVETAATIRCKPRTISLGMSELYEGPGGTGVVRASTAPTGRERAFTPIEKGSSDEDLWGHLCGAGAGKKP